VMSLLTFHARMVLVSPPWGRRERGFPVLHYNLAMPIKNIIPGQTVTKEKLQRAKELRRDMTPAEKILWQELRANKLGVHFRRQQVVAGFIVDFYCHKAALVIEVDGDIHDLQQEEDVRREKVLREMGLRIVRFRNEEVMKNMSAVVVCGLVA
jgi:very-short-patch-repair endonuclease